MEINALTYNKIRDYYQRALLQIRKGDYKKANEILYKEMSKELYDISLDILFQANNYDKLAPSLKKLFDIIDEVDNLINPKQEDDI